MSDFNPPSYNDPTPPAKETSFYQKPWFWVIIAVVVVVGLFQNSSNNSTTTSATNPPVIVQEDTTTSSSSSTTQYVAPRNKYDKYIDFVYQYSPVAYVFTEADTIELGDLACNALDAGNSMRSVVAVLENNSEGEQKMIDHFAAVLMGAVEYICPQHKSALQSFLNS